MEDFIQELGYLALASRLKRISDRMVQSGKQLYKQLDLDIEPNWYLVFKLLQQKGDLSITEIAQYLQFAHPSVITLVNKMTKKGYLESKACRQDGRKNLISLTNKAKEALPEMEKIWQAGEESIQILLKSTPMLDILSRLEVAFDKKDFMNRTLDQLEHDKK